MKYVIATVMTWPNLWFIAKKKNITKNYTDKRALIFNSQKEANQYISDMNMPNYYT